ncbi:MAG: sulfurtransferase TusA family protein, partial [Nitrososphaerales archaeon]
MLKKATLHPDKVLDTEDAICPVPVLMTREAMQGLKTGQMLKVITRDPTAETDISVWAGRIGNRV